MEEPLSKEKKEQVSLWEDNNSRAEEMAQRLKARLKAKRQDSMCQQEIES